MSSLRFTPEFVKACELLWRDGFDKGVNGEDDFPEFKSFFGDVFGEKVVVEKVVEKKVKEVPSYEDASKLPFNPEKCEARLEKFGFAIQCTRNPFVNGCLCKTHQNSLDRLGPAALNEGKDLKYGRFNQDRPDCQCDTGTPIKWDGLERLSKKTTKIVAKHDKSVKSVKSVKPKMGEMRDYLSSRIPNTVFKEMNKPEMTVLYLSEKEKEEKNSSSDEETSPIGSPGSEESDRSEEQITFANGQTLSIDRGPAPTLEPEPEPEEPEEEPEPEPEPEEEEEPEEKGGLSLEPVQEPVQGPVQPKTVLEYKELFKSLNIDFEGLKGGGRAFKQAYADYLEEEAEKEKTQPLSDEDDDLQEDTMSYTEMDFEGVSYLEDEATGEIYNMKHELLGKWDEDMDNIIWRREQAPH